MIARHTHSDRERRGEAEESQERRMIRHVREELSSVTVYVLWSLTRLLDGSSLLAVCCGVLKRLTTPLSSPIMTGQKDHCLTGKVEMLSANSIPQSVLPSYVLLIPHYH